MSNKAPTLFDDFFPEDEPQDSKPVKKQAKKKQANDAFLLFDMDAAEPAEDEKTKESEPREIFAAAQNDEEKREHGRDIDSAHEGIEEAKKDTPEEQDAVMIVSEELSLPDDNNDQATSLIPFADLPEDSESDNNPTSEDMEVLNRQYTEDIDYFSRPESRFLPDLPEAEIPDPACENDTPEPEESEGDTMEALESFVPQDWNLTKHYYSIGEVAKMFDVNISHIRFWSNEFRLNPRTNKKGNRYYTPQQIETLQLIHYLVKEKKYTIKGAREKLKAHKKLVQNNMVLKDSLLSLRSKLEELKKQF